jgi:hypothetical protein
LARQQEADHPLGVDSIRFSAPVLSPEGAAGNPAGYWDDFLDHAPIEFLECTNALRSREPRSAESYPLPI